MTAWRERVLDLDGPVRVIDYGGTPGRTFLCVHGLGGWALDWQAFAPQLTRHGHVVALDLPGFGDSPLEGRSASITAQQQLLDRYLAVEVQAPVVLVGNSMGGMIALLQAAMRPQSVERLVLLSPVLPASLRRLPHPLVTTQFLVYALPQVGEWYIRARRRYTGDQRLVDTSLMFLTVYPDRIPRHVYEQRYALTARLAAAADSDRAFLEAARSLLSLLAAPGRYRRLIAAVATPTLILHGADDRLVPAAAARQLARSRADWRVHVFEDVGHLPQLEVPAESVGVLAQWLATASTLADYAGAPRR
jgi:pimeloyl-ACP methyl ester carboxylesterase